MLTIPLRGLLWTVTGAATAVVCWSVLGGITWTLRFRAQDGSALADLPLAIAGSMFWASFVGLVSAVVYLAPFAVWLYLVRDRPALEATAARRWLAALLGSLPASGTVIWSFGESFQGFNWAEAAWIAPIAVISCWAGVGLPRRWLPKLQPARERTDRTGSHVAAV